jgi:hypothetical protein
MGIPGKPVYFIWVGIRQRCMNPELASWPRYGGRGIRVCDRWNDYRAFEADMGPRPSLQHSIDRIDNEGDYTPENCRWATRSVQMANRAACKFVTIEGTRHKINDLVKMARIRSETIVERAERGLPLSEVLSARRFHNTSGLALGGHANGERQRQRTHCKSGHAFTAENTSITPEGWRRCRTCHCIRMRRRTAAKSASFASGAPTAAA